MSEPPGAPWPLVSTTIDPKTDADRRKLATALTELATEDSCFRVSTDPLSGQTLLQGLGEDHLDTKIGILRRRYGVDAEVGLLRVSYRETITRAADIDYTHKKLSGSSAEFARVKLHAAPGPIGSDFVFTSKIAGGAIPQEYIAGVRTGCESAARAGVVASFPVVSVEVLLVDGAFHKTDSSTRAFESASHAAFRAAVQQGDAAIIEPIMTLEVVTPREYSRSVINDLNARRGWLQHQDITEKAVAITALIPLANTFGMANVLSHISNGEARFAIQYSHYERIPTPNGKQPPPVVAMSLRA